MNYFLLLIIMALGILARSKLLVIATIILVCFRFFKMREALRFFAEHGINLGLLLLILTVLVPITSGQVTIKEVKNTVTSLPGIVAILGGLFATKLNGMGINLLKIQPQLIVGMVLGSIIGIVFWGGVPVGPLMAGGLTALLIKLIQMLS